MELSQPVETLGVAALTFRACMCLVSPTQVVSRNVLGIYYISLSKNVDISNPGVQKSAGGIPAADLTPTGRPQRKTLNAGKTDSEIVRNFLFVTVLVMMSTAGAFLTATSLRNLHAPNLPPSAFPDLRQDQC